MLQWQDKPIFIGGHRKSGTTLIPCLFDGNDEVISLPYDTGFFYGFYPVCNNTGLSDEAKIELAIKYLCKNDLVDQLKIAGKYNKTKNELALLEESFYDSFTKSSKTPREALLCFVNSFKKIFFDNNKSPKAWLQKTTSSEIYAKEIFEWFPNAKFIHIIRDPRDNFASLKSGWEKLYSLRTNDSNELIQSMIDRGKLCMELAKLNSQRFGKQKYMVIKFEDIVTDPKKYVKKICDFVEIQYEENLLQPTVFGHHWRGNNLEDKNFKGISSSNINEWENRILKSEAYLIEYYFRSLMEHFNYEIKFDINNQIDAAVKHYNWYNKNQSFKV